MELVILVGLPDSGKSTFFRDRFAATHVLVSKDLLKNNRQPARRQHELIEQALGQDRSVVVDNTNPRRTDRAGLIELARRHGARVTGYVFTSGAADCLARNRQREGKARVPAVAIYTAARRMEPPRREEGFDLLYCVDVAPPSGFTVTEWAPAAGGLPLTT